MKRFRFAIFMLFIFNILSAQNNMGGGGMDFSQQDFPCLTAEKRVEIQQQLDASIQDLLNRGIIEPAKTEQVTLMEWPVIGALGQTDYGYHGISNFVDQNSAFPNQLQDYNCGERTYDLASGYNHQGVDIFTWPFGWYRMDHDEIIIVAAAPGTIIFKASGNNDRSCGFNGSNWNAVYVQHSDGSVAWYGHMKKNSPTVKNIGETVVAGEYLGVVGSSGNSTGPHLHLELHDAGGNLIEPFQGSCNSLNTESWWAEQRPYYDSAINRVMTHSAPPVFPSCPSQEVVNEKDAFQANETVYFATYYRDQLNGQISQYSIRQPNGAIWQSWSHASTETHYQASYWYWWWNLPLNPQNGVWQFEVIFEGETYVHDFTVGTVGIDDQAEKLQTFKLNQNYPNPFNPTTTISYEMPVSGSVKITVFDAMGREVRRLVNQMQPAGSHTVEWNGKAANGNRVESGVYYYRLETGNFRETRQMTLTQ